MDLPFVFNHLETSTGRELTGNAPPQSLADAMHGAWANFVVQGDPGWPEHGPGTPWMQFFDDLGWCGPAPASATLEAWDGVL